MNHSHRSRLTLTLSVPFALLALAACGSDSGSSSNTSAASSATPTTIAAVAPTITIAATTPAGGSAAPSAAVDVKLTTNSLGTILTDGQGNTLYLFMNDSPTASTCTGGCASTWPAFALNATPALAEGLDAEHFVNINGPDGAPQTTFYGHPLYYYAGDTGPGATSGQGIGGVWFVVDKDGNPIK